MRDLRRHLRDERARPREQASVRGYWRIGTVGALPREED
ncbi:hypothetical protein [Dactylosporangium darangshiense]